jgi:flagellar biosynthesis protein FliQ
MFSIMTDALFLTVTLSGVALIGIAFISGGVALIQGAMQLQESSISHLVKVIAFVIVAVLGGEWAAHEVAALFERVVQSVAEIQRELR